MKLYLIKDKDDYVFASSNLMNLADKKEMERRLEVWKGQEEEDGTVYELFEVEVKK